jgi:tetratricopeptide (TPR) repeat protein
MDTDFEYLSTRHFNREELHTYLHRATATDVEAAFEEPVSAVAEPFAEEINMAEAFDEHGRAETARGRYAAARAMHERAMEIRRSVHGEADPRLTRSFTLLGNLSLIELRFDEAEWLYDQAHQAAMKQFGAAHPAVAMILHNLGVLARRRGELTTARSLYEQALAIKQSYFGEGHPSVAATLANLGNLARLQGDMRASMGYYGRAREIYEETEGGVCHGLASTLVGMGRVHLELGVHESAIFMLERALRIREALHVSPAQLAGCRYLLAVAMARSRPEEAHALLVLAIREYELSCGARDECIASMRGWLERLSAGRVVN